MGSIGEISAADSLSNSSIHDSFSVPFLVVIAGATATGKSQLAVDLAGRLDAAILSADSRQIYREFDIGTAKPSAAERKQVDHYLIDICEPTETLTLADYQRQAQGVIERCHRRRQLPLLVGGTGLYIDAVVRGLKIPPVAPQAELRSQLHHLGQPHSYALLQQVDAAAAARIHPRDPVRTQRALEVFYVTGHPISQLQGEQPPAYPVLYLVLDLEPNQLERRIRQRTEVMVAQGLVAEVQRLGERYGWSLPLLSTLGYSEMAQHLRGDLSLQEAMDLTVRHTRQFAKRQRTWFRNRTQGQWLEATAPDLVEQACGKIATFLQTVAAAASGRS